MSDTRPLLIVNPRSGGGKTGETFGAMRRTIESRLGELDVELTDHAGHAIELARAAVTRGRTFLVAVGGDGTLNEVVNGVMLGRRQRAREAAETAGSDEVMPRLQVEVGLIGQGTGGDFRKTLGIEHRLDRYLDALVSGQVRELDVGRCEYTDVEGKRAERWFVNILSAGMGGLVDRYVADASRKLGGTAAYFGASLRALAEAQRGRLVCRVRSGDGEVVEEKRLETYMIAVCNGQYFGSGMRVAPMARCDDGQLEVVAIGGEGKLAFALTARSIYSGGHLGKAGTAHFPCRAIDIELANSEARSRFLIDCDGEPIGGLPLHIELEPAALRFRG